MIDDDAPITLEAACKLWPEAKLTVSTLRAEAARNRLDIFRIGRRDYTTAQAMREMVRKCQEEGRLRASTSTRREGNGSSRTAGPESALAALRMSVAKPRNI
jgi:hypothetical protein